MPPSPPGPPFPPETPAAVPPPLPAQSARDGGMTVRVLAVALVLVPVNSLFVLFMSYERNIFDPTLVALFWNVLFVVGLVRLVNGLLRRWRPGAAFSPAEMLVLWVLMAVSTSGSGMDSMQCTFMTLQGPAHLASPENHWADLFMEKVPAALTVSDEGALERIWNGGGSILEMRNLRVWAGPVFRWWLLMSVLWATPVGLMALLRKRWIEQEKMGFPIVQLPLEIVQTRARFVTRPAFWVAVSVPVLINLLNGFHTYYPQVPSFPTSMWDPRLDLGKYLAGMGRPWNASAGMFFMCLYPFILGLGLLLPAELSLSLWFFFLFWRAEMIMAAWLGFQQTWDAPYTVSAGSYLALVGFPLWAARHQLAGLLRRGVASGETGAGEPMSYRTAILVVLGGLTFVVWMGVANGLSFPVSLGFFVQYLVMGLIIGRIRAEMGMPTHELERMGPTVVQGTILGPRVLGLQNLTTLSAFFGFTRGMRNIPLPHQFEGLYFASKAGVDGRKLLWATVPFISLGLAWGWFWTLYLSYFRGLGTYRGSFHTWFSGESWYQLAGWLSTNAPMNWGRVGAGALGFVVYWGMMVVRSQFVAWPLHPAGFALSTTYYMCHMWFPMFLAWGIKVGCARWGGFGAVRGLPMIAYGLILGDVGSGALWILYAMVRHVPAYAFWQ
jgi:hypothetical protein